MHVMIAAIPTMVGQFDPTPQAENFAMPFPSRHLDYAVIGEIFRPASKTDVVLARRQQHRFAAVAINLIVKEKVGRKPARTRRVHPLLLIANHEVRRRWLAIVVDDFELHGDGWLSFKEHR